MYKVLLVDDEYFITEGLKSMINWPSYNFEVIGTASCGEELIELFKESPADIIITDINMYDINGLELIEIIKNIDSNVRFIILSGYDDFEYIQKGITLGIENYLLKPINEEELIQTLKNTVEKIKKTTDIKKLLYSNVNILKNNILYRLVTNNIEHTELLERCSLLNIKLDYEYYIVSCINISEYLSSKNINYSQNLLSSIYSLCNKVIANNSEFVCFSDLEDNIVIIHGSNTEFKMLNNLTNLLKLIRNDVKKLLSIDCFITIGTVYKNLYTINKSYEEAKKSQEYMILQPVDSIIYFNDLYISDEQKLIQVDLKLNNLHKILSSNNSNTIMEFIDDFYTTLKKGNYITPTDVQNYTIKFILSAIRYSNEINQHTDTPFNDYKNIFNSVLNIPTIDGLKEEVKNYINNIIQLDIEDTESFSPIIGQIVKYINLNLSKDLSLKTLGIIFNINSAYLGQLFLKEVGLTLSKYVTKLRMNKSKELLLNTDLTINEIANEIGFYDSNYFYKKFKDHFNYSPNEFRNTMAVI